MKKAIKNIKVQWNWDGDFNALQGFNIAFTPENETPHSKAFSMTYVPKGMLETSGKTFTYTVANTLVDVGSKILTWVQTVYRDGDSEWVSQDGGIVSDDGKATIATGEDIQTVNQTITQINVTLGEINTKIGQYQEDVDGYKQQLSQITQTANEIRAEVFDSNGNSKIEQLSDSIELKVEQKDIEKAINEIEVGGRNLLFNSREIEKSNWGSDHQTASEYIADEGGYREFTSNRPDANAYFWLVRTGHVDLDEIELDKEYTISADLRGESGARFGVRSESSEGNEVFLKTHNNINPETWTRVYTTFKFTREFTDILMSVRIPTTNHKLHIRRIKLEKGNKATDWTPAPEDLTNPENIISRINLAPSGVTIQGNKIDFLGNAVFQSLTTTEAGTTVIDGGKIATNSILAKSIKANDLKVYNNSGQLMTEIKSDGTIWAKNGYFEGEINASSGTFTGKVNATSGTFTGRVNATSGTFNGLIYADRGKIGSWEIMDEGLAKMMSDGELALITPNNIALHDPDYLGLGSMTSILTPQKLSFRSNTPDGKRKSLDLEPGKIDTHDDTGAFISISPSLLKIGKDINNSIFINDLGVLVSKNETSYYIGEWIRVYYRSYLSEGSTYSFTTDFAPKALLFAVLDNGGQTGMIVLPNEKITTGYDYTVPTEPSAAMDFCFTFISSSKTTFQIKYIGDWKSGTYMKELSIYATY